MKHKVYSIKDMKVGSFNPPCLFANDAQAIRAFSDLISNDKQSIMSLHPEDFGLYCLGEFDGETGVITPCQASLLCVGSDFVKSDK